METQNEIPRIKTREKFSFAFGDIGCNAVWAAMGSYIAFYYTNSVGIAAAAVGTIFMASRVFDGFMDIAIGNLVDRTRTKYGKARPWLLWMAVPFLVATILVFSVPNNWDPIAKIIFAFITYNVMNIAYTSVNLPYGVMTGLITDNPKDRLSLNLFRMVGVAIMTSVSSAAAVPMITAVGGARGTADPMAWTIVFGAFGVFAMIFIFLCFKGIKERIKPVKKEIVPFRVAFPVLLRNRNWLAVLFASLASTVAGGLMAINVYYAQYFLGNANLVSSMTIALYLPTIAGLIIAQPLIKKFGKKTTVIAGCTLFIVGSLPLLFSQSLPIVLLALAIRGIGFGPFQAAGLVMLTDSIDYGEWKYGIRSDGLAFSVSSFAGKIGMGLGAGLIGWILAAGNYDATLATQRPQAMAAINALFVYGPAICAALTIVSILFYSIDKQLPQIRAELMARRQASVELESQKAAGDVLAADKG